MATNVSPSLQFQQISLAEHNGSSSAFFHIAAQFLANTPVLKTRETYGRELGFFISWYGRDGSTASITFEDLLRYKSMLDRQYSPATVMKKIAALRSFFKFAKRIEAISDNPAEELRVAGPTKNRVPTHLSVEEVQRLIKMPDRRTTLGNRDAAILALLANTGMRRAELINLKMDSFIYHTEKHKQKAKVYVKILGKGNKERMVMVHENVLPYLEDWLKVRLETDHDFFFTTRDRKPLSVKAVRYLIQKHGKAAGISEEKLHPHSFRHTFCINLARAAVPLHVIQELTGHKMLNTLRIYLKVTQEETDKAIAKLPSWNRNKRGQSVFSYIILRGKRADV
jgi:site-specific recombinase XerD